MASKLIASELAKTERLNGTNYDMWHRKIRYGLIHDNLEHVLEVEPPILGDSPTELEKKIFEKWLLEDKKAKSLMLMFMEDSLIKVFEHYKTASDMWLAIKEKYDFTSEVNIQLMLHKFNTCRMQEGECVTEHINKMIVMAKDLAVAGTEIPENVQVGTILNSLPPSFDMAATTLRLNGTAKSVTNLPAQLSLEQDLAKQRIIMNVNLAQHEEANAVMHRTGKKAPRHIGPSKPSFKKPKQQHTHKKGPPGSCYNCGKFGHYKANCPQENNKDNKGKRPEQGGTSKREFVGVIECNAVTTDAAGWWIDSGATRHIAKTKEGVTEFKELKKGEQRIYMGNSTYLDVEGIASYRLDLGDSIMVLKDVFYAPGIRRNLISVPALLKKGLEVRFYNNRVSIGKNNKVLAMGKFVPEQDLFCLSVVPVINNESSSLN